MKKFELTCRCEHCSKNNIVATPEWFSGVIKFEVSAEQINTDIEVTCENCKLPQKVHIGLVVHTE